MTPEEINEAVARKLGWTYFHSGAFSGWGFDTLEPTQASPPDYCRSIEAAWEIVKFITKESENKGCGPIVELAHDGQWHFKIGVIQSQADTAPMAICQAFLKLSNVEVPA